MARAGIQQIGQLREDTIAGLRLHFSLSNPAPPSRLYQKSQKELDEEFDAAASALDNQFMFALLAEIEALLRDDFKTRKDAKSPQALNAAFRRIAKARGKRVRLEEDIISTWKESRPEFSPLTGEIKTALKLRHWLAHGQHFHPRLGRKHDYLQLETIAYAAQEMVNS